MRIKSYSKVFHGILLRNNTFINVNLQVPAHMSKFIFIVSTLLIERQMIPQVANS